MVKIDVLTEWLIYSSRRSAHNMKMPNKFFYYLAAQGNKKGFRGSYARAIRRWKARAPGRFTNMDEYHLVKI